MQGSSSAQYYMVRLHEHKSIRAHINFWPTVRGIVVILFFQCLAALLNPTNGMKRWTRWGPVAHTAAMFLFLTLAAGARLGVYSVSYIDNLGFPGDDEGPLGPLGTRASPTVIWPT